MAGATPDGSTGSPFIAGLWTPVGECGTGKGTCQLGLFAIGVSCTNCFPYLKLSCENGLGESPQPICYSKLHLPQQLPHSQHLHFTNINRAPDLGYTSTMSTLNRRIPKRTIQSITMRGSQGASATSETPKAVPGMPG